MLDVSSTSSEESDHDTPLTQLQTQELIEKVTHQEQCTVETQYSNGSIVKFFNTRTQKFGLILKKM